MNKSAQSDLGRGRIAAVKCPLVIRLNILSSTTLVHIVCFPVLCGLLPLMWKSWLLHQLD